MLHILNTRISLSLAFLLAGLGLGAPAAYARVDPPHPLVDPRHVQGTGLQPVDLTSAWLLKQGDNPRFADPALDDRDWLVAQSGHLLNAYGLKDVKVLWYRTHVQIPPNSHDLSLLVRAFGGFEHVYVNGVQVGTFGSETSRLRFESNSNDLIFALPDALVASGNLTIAIRDDLGTMLGKGITSGGFSDQSAILLGGREAIAGNSSLWDFRQYTSNYTNLALQFVLLLVAVALAVALRSEREYLALVCYVAAQAARGVVALWIAACNVDTSLPLIVLNGLEFGIAGVALIEFVRIILGLRRSRLFIAYERLLAFIALIVFPTVNYLYAFTALGTSLFSVAINVIANILLFPLDAGLPVLALWTWWRRRNTDALLIFVPLFFGAIINYWQFFVLVLTQLAIDPHASMGEPPIQWLYVGWSEIASFIASVTLLLFLVLRTVRIARARAQALSEIAAAQTVQQVLLARASQPTPGFEVETVYRPASEVGGDFFLISPGPDRSLVAVIGDVSGKGMMAAMRVSMILGVLRREASRDPATILAGLNDALLTQGDMGFTTACCVRVEHSGAYSIANAGHIAPYVRGCELQTAPALPLGLEADQRYELTTGVLPVGSRIVLMSDGVVEARSSTGELYGFERLPALTLKPAREIASEAVHFGQEDDITVVSVACAA